MMAISVPSMVVLSLRNPREAARIAVEARLPERELWYVMVLGAILSVLPTYMFLYFGEVPDDAFGQMVREAFPFPPFVAATLQLGQAAIGVFVIHWSGAAFNGTGTRRDVLGVLALLQILSLILLFGVTLIGMILPILSLFGLLIFICWWLYAIVLFVDEAHGFYQPFKSALMLVGALVATLICSSIALSFVGAVLISLVGAN